MNDDRVVLISGGSRGLGAQLVADFLADGCRVATFSRNISEQVEQWRSDPHAAGRFCFEALDVTDSEAIGRFVDQVCERWSRVDVLVNNAGVALDGLLPLLSDEAIDRMIGLNLTSTIRLTRRVLRRMLLAERGRIISISSVAGVVGLRGLSAYGAAKAGIDGFTRGLAREVGPRNITVNGVAPGYLRTEMTDGIEPQQLQQIVRRTPLGRLGDPRDVSSVVRFLASDAAGFITGQTLIVDGGFSC